MMGLWLVSRYGLARYKVMQMPTGTKAMRLFHISVQLFGLVFLPGICEIVQGKSYRLKITLMITRKGKPEYVCA